MLRYRTLIFLTLLSLQCVSTQVDAAPARNQSGGGSLPNGCVAGAYSVVTTDDGTTLSVLFDNFIVTSGAAGGTVTNTCSIHIPLNLPAGFSLGVYRVDYRGYSHLSGQQSAGLSVDYALGPHQNSRRFQRRLPGAHEGDFLYSENIGAGLMKRVGCGQAAVLDLTATLEVQSVPQASAAVAALDSVDGAPAGGIIYRFNLRRCGEP